MRKVLTPHNARLKTVPSLIKCARQNLMFKIFIVPKKIKQNKKTHTKIIKDSKVTPFACVLC